MSTNALPRVPNGHGYCWTENPRTHARCTQPAGHPPRDGNGGHWNPYTRSSW